eukprot:6206020-Pleurochrysis_carterae.AAC.2
MHLGWQRLREHVRNVVVSVYFAHFDTSVRHILAHFQIAPINVARTLAGSPFSRELDRARFVDVHWSGSDLSASHFGEQAAEVYNFGGGVRGGHDLCFG